MNNRDKLKILLIFGVVVLLGVVAFLILYSSVSIPKDDIKLVIDEELNSSWENYIYEISSYEEASRLGLFAVQYDEIWCISFENPIVATKSTRSGSQIESDPIYGAIVGRTGVHWELQGFYTTDLSFSMTGDDGETFEKLGCSNWLS